MWAGGGRHAESTLDAPLGALISRCSTPHPFCHCRNFCRPCRRCGWHDNTDLTTTSTPFQAPTSLSPGHRPPNPFQDSARARLTGVHPRGTSPISTSIFELTADRPVLTMPLSLGPRDSFPADSAAEDSTICQSEHARSPLPPPPHPGSRITGRTASLEYVSFYAAMFSCH